jgi:hypothetical protein
MNFLWHLQQSLRISIIIFDDITRLIMFLGYTVSAPRAEAL